MALSRREFLGGLALSPSLSWLGGLSSPNNAHAQNTINGAFNMAAFTPPFPAPTISAHDLEGKPRRIGPHQNKTFVLVNFWATWCPPCVRELPSLEQAMTKLGRDRFIVLAISVDKARDLHKIEKFRDKYALTFPIIHDQESATAKVYGVHQFPSTFLVAPDGNVVAAAKGERDWHTEPAIKYFSEVMNRYGQS